ncbi:hypothetical protein [Bartonella sp. LJL80]
MTTNEKAQSNSVNAQTIDRSSPNTGSVPNRSAMKTSQTIVDGGNMEDRGGPWSNPDNPVLKENIAESNLSVDKDVSDKH